MNFSRSLERRFSSHAIVLICNLIFFWGGDLYIYSFLDVCIAYFNSQVPEFDSIKMYFLSYDILYKFIWIRIY